MTETETHPASTKQLLNTGLYAGLSVTALLADGRLRRAFITGPADTFFSVPARASIDGRKVAGFISCATVEGWSTETEGDPAVIHFTPYRYDETGA